MKIFVIKSSIVYHLSSIVLIIALSLAGCSTVKPVSQKCEVSASQKNTNITVLAENLFFNIEKGEIGYTLPEDSYVRIRVGIKDGGPLLTHVLDWEYREQGAHVETWDGKVDGMEGDLRQRKDLMINFFAVSAKKSEEGLQKPLLKKAPQFSLSFLDSMQKNDLGVAVIRGTAPIKITLAPEDEYWLSTTRYEIAMFIDQIFLMEEEEGVSPFTYYLDTKKMSDGVHTLTVNVVGYEGDAAVSNTLVVVDNKGH